MDEVFNRLHNRNRDEEMTLTREYQENLQKQHNNFKSILFRYKESKIAKIGIHFKGNTHEIN